MYLIVGSRAIKRRDAIASLHLGSIELVSVASRPESIRRASIVDFRNKSTTRATLRLRLAMRFVYNFSGNDLLDREQKRSTGRRNEERCQSGEGKMAREPRGNERSTRLCSARFSYIREERGEARERCYARDM